MGWDVEKLKSGGSKNRLCYRASEGTWSCWQLDLGFLVFRTVKGYVCAVLSHLPVVICHNSWRGLLQMANGHGWQVGPVCHLWVGAEGQGIFLHELLVTRLLGSKASYPKSSQKLSCPLWFILSCSHSLVQSKRKKQTHFSKGETSHEKWIWGTLV